MDIRWIELKSLDKSTNHTSRTEMIKRILAEGHRIRYYCGYKKEKKYFGLDEGTINYIPVPPVPKLRTAFFYAGMLWQMIRLLYFARPDALIIDYASNLLAFPFLMAKKVLNRKTRVVLDVRTVPVDRERFERSQKIFLLSLALAKRTCDGMTFITPFMREYCSDRIGLERKKTSTWTSGFSEELFDPSRYSRTRADGGFEFFYHGGIALSRGVGSLIEAVKILREKDYPVSLTLIGNVVKEAEIRACVAENGLDDACRIVPPVPHEQVPQWIENCDLPVIPLPDFIGWRVSSPIKLMEYMAMGKSMVLTDIEAHRQVADHHPFAFFAPSSRPEDLAGAMEQAFRCRDELDRRGEKAREIALERYTWKQQAEKLLSFIGSLANE